MSDEVNAWVAEAVQSIDKILREFREEYPNSTKEL